MQCKMQCKMQSKMLHNILDLNNIKNSECNDNILGSGYKIIKVAKWFIGANTARVRAHPGFKVGNT